MDEPLTAAPALSAIVRRITLAVTNHHARAPGAPRLNNRSFTRVLKQSLSAGDADDDCRDILCIDESIEVLRASKIGKMNDVIRYLRNFAAHFLSRSQVELYTFSSAALEKTDDRGIRLQGGFILSEHAATCARRHNSYEKKKLLFHDCSFCGITRRFASK
jgi:hypothetical protein